MKENGRTGLLRGRPGRTRHQVARTYFRTKCHEWNIPHAKACRKPELDLESNEGSSTKSDDVS